MRLALDLLTALLASAGLFFMLVAAMGVLRMPDLFTRMHAATKASTLGISGILLAALVYFQATGAVTTKVALIVLFFFLTAPVGAHALGRAAYLCGVPMWPQTHRFDLARARIVCPTRGGPPSQTAHEKAIELARESRGELTFLHVVKRDLIEGAAGTGEALRLLNEMRALGQSILAAAQAQAETRGVTARGEVRVGEVDAEIVRFAQEMEATIVVLGYPEKASTSEQQVSEEHVWALAQALREQAGAQVVMAR